MFSVGSIQPQLSQLAMPLSQLSNVWNSMRSAGQVGRSVRQRQLQQSVNSSGFVVTASLPEGRSVQEIHNTVQSTLGDLGLDVTEGLCVEEIQSPVLKPELVKLSNHFGENYVSCHSFFENKNGFSESAASETAERYVQIALPKLKYFPQSVMHQSVRGFKTDRSSTSTGFGAEPEDVLPSRRLLKLSSSPRSKKDLDEKTKNSKLQSLLTEHEVTPDVAEKLKIAFAEGYSANSGSSTDSKDVPKSKLTKRLQHMLILSVTIWLVITLWNTLQQLFMGVGGKVRLMSMNEGFEAVNPEDISVSFDDVKGCDEAKQELQDVVEYLKNPNKFKDLGAKLPKGVLLVGPPGIGKTLLARAVAGEAVVPFFHTSGSEFDEMFVGTGAKRVRALFEAAKVRAPCVIFIDEIDTVGAKRTSSTIHPYANQTINQLLSEMDGFNNNTGVIVLGATNRRGNLDSALLRPGRFDVEVRVFPPDLKGRRDILELYMSKVKVSKDICLDQIAKSTTGCTGADLENIVNQAALKAALDGDSEVDKIHLEHAMDKVFMGPEKKSKIPDEEVNLSTAFHEAGHTIVAFYTKDAIPVRKVTIMPRGMSLGHTSMVPEKDRYNMTKAQLLAELDVAMGGRVAEEIIYGPDKVTTGASSDFTTATNIATAMVKLYGMSDKVGVRVFSDNQNEMMSVNTVSPHMTETIDTEIKTLLQDSYERAKALLRNHHSELKGLAEALMEYETLDLDDIKIVMKGKKLKKVKATKNDKDNNGQNSTSDSDKKISSGQPKDPSLSFLTARK